MITYKQIVIAQVGSSDPQDFFAPYRGLVWWKDTYLSVTDQLASFWTVNFGGTYDDLYPEPVILNTVTYDGRQLSQVDTLAELFLPNVFDSFYFDNENQRLYLKNFDNLPPWQTDGISAGVVNGYSSSADVGPDNRPFNQVYFGQEFEPRLMISTVSDKQKLDDWYKNLMQFESITLSLVNADGELDGIRENIMNQKVDILLAEVPDGDEVLSSDFNIIRTGNINDVGFPGAETAKLSAADRRKFWEDTIPNNVYAEGFGGLAADADIIGRNMPLVVGNVNKSPLQAIDKDLGIYHASWCDADYPLTSVTTVYTFTDGAYVSRAFSVDLDTGLITLSVPAQATGAVVADMVGIQAPSISGNGLPNTPLDIALFLIGLFGSLPYIPSNYYQSVINAVRDERDYQAGIYIPTGGQTLKNVIDKCTFSINTAFYQAGDLLSVAVITPEIPADPLQVYPDEIAEAPGISYDNRDYMSRINTGYNPNYHDKTFAWIYSDTHEDEAVLLYQFKKQYDFETILIDGDDAAEVGEERYGLSYTFVPSLDVQFNSPLEFNLLDVIMFEYTFNGRERFPLSYYRVVEMSKIRRTATLKYISEVTG